MLPPPTSQGKGQAVPQFDLATALTKKEGRVIRKAENMIPYHMARCPNYGWKESEEYSKANVHMDLLNEIGGAVSVPGQFSEAKSTWVAQLTG